MIAQHVNQQEVIKHRSTSSPQIEYPHITSVSRNWLDTGQVNTSLKGCHQPSVCDVPVNQLDRSIISQAPDFSQNSAVIGWQHANQASIGNRVILRYVGRFCVLSCFKRVSDQFFLILLLTLREIFVYLSIFKCSFLILKKKTQILLVYTKKNFPPQT